MSRVVFLMDKIMRNFGLSGKSVVPLISGTACAIPALWQHEILKTGRSD
jgi:ferrous iron transport protein B